jgi:c-di-GMP-binding flagellar brake protein YcgR
MYAVGIIVVLLCILLLVTFEERRHRAELRKTFKTSKLWDGAERRKTVRVNCELDVKYNLLPSKEGANLKSVSKDISEGGLKLIVDEKMTPGSTLELELSLPNHKSPLKVKGRVAWQREIPGDIKKTGIRCFATGIEFIRVARSDRRGITDFINNQLRAN